MKRKHGLEVVAGVVVATLLGGMSIVGCTSDSAKAESTKKVAVQGWVYANAPLQHAAVTISTANGKTVVAKAKKATGATGTFSQSAQVPASYRVAVDGGTLGDEVFTGELVADVDQQTSSSGLIQVNALTTLLAAYRDRHPNLSSAQAQAAVRRYLQLPDGFDLNADLRGLEHHFSAAEFQRQAQAAGGTQRFVKQLVAEIDARPAVTRSFAGAPQNDLTTDALKAAAKAAAKYGMTKLLGQFGLEPPDQVVTDALNRISGQLSDLQKSINDLQTLVLTEAFKASARPAFQLANQINTAFAYMVFGAANDSALGKQRTQDSITIVDQLATTGAGQLNLRDYLMGTGQGGAYQALSDYLLSDGTFWTPQKSTTLLNFFDYFDSVQSQLVMLLAERNHRSDPDHPENIEAQSTTPALKGALTVYNENHAAELAIRPVAAPTVIDKRTKLMWPITTGDRADTEWWGQLYDMDRLNGCISLGNIRIACGINSLYGFQDWRLPETGELTALFKGQANPRAWLQLPQNWGPTAFKRALPLTDVVNIWSGTHDSNQATEYHYLSNVTNGKASSQRDSTLATIWPVRAAVEKYWL